VEKPVSPEHSGFAEMSATIRQTVQLMSEVKVVRRWAAARAANQRVAEGATIGVGQGPGKVRVIGIGASTGGPPVLQTILAGLPKNFPVPILIVQHIARGFLTGLADWLNQSTAFQVHIGGHGMLALPGHVYLAPDDFHMGVSAGERIFLSKAEPETGLRPAVAFLFRSLAETFGRDAVGVLLTGMGRDGAAELKQMKDAGAVTIAQDRESSVVHGMPGEAIAQGGATHILAAEKIASTLATLIQRRNACGDSSP
jgi:two-component system chemotaxis response regulator CheB